MELKSEPVIEKTYKDTMELLKADGLIDNASPEEARTIIQSLSAMADTWYYRTRNPEIILSAVIVNSLFEIVNGTDADIHTLLTKIPKIHEYTNNIVNSNPKQYDVDNIHEEILEMLKC